MPDLIVTAVAFYGPKTGALKDLAESVQAIVHEQLGDGFRPYTLDQIHGTVIRLDGFIDPETGSVVSLRYRESPGPRPPMDSARGQEILAAGLTPPLRIRVGGFRPGEAAAFSSRGQHPYERSFALTRDALSRDAFVLMGWPESTIAHGSAVQPLDDLRRELSQANIPHWYHSGPGDVDNDLHLVVGHLTTASPDAAAAAVHAVRSYLAGHPTELEVGVEQLAVIASYSATLAPAEFVGRLPVKSASIARLYR
jgi:hypothetical protein